MAQTPPFTATKATGSWGWLPGNHTPVPGSCPLPCSPTSVSPFVMMSPPPPRLLCSVAEQSFSHKEQFGLLWLKMWTLMFVLERFHPHPVIATQLKYASYFGPNIYLLHPMSFLSFSRVTVYADCGERGRRTRLGRGDLGVPAHPLSRSSPCSPLTQACFFFLWHQVIVIPTGLREGEIECPPTTRLLNPW